MVAERKTRSYYKFATRVCGSAHNHQCTMAMHMEGNWEQNYMNMTS